MEDEELEKELEGGSPLLIDQHRSAICAAVVCARILKQYDIPKLIQLVEAVPTIWSDPQAEEDMKALQAALPLWGLVVPPREDEGSDGIQ